MMAGGTLDHALADLVEAFGHYSKAELQAFLDATPPADMDFDAAAADPVATAGWLGIEGFASGEAQGPVQAARA